MFKEKPTPQQLEALWMQQRAFYANAHGKMGTTQGLYEGNFDWLADMVPSGVDIHRPSTASSIIDHFRDNVRVQRILPERDEWGTSQEARSKRALLLRLDSYIINRIRKEAPVDPFSQVIFDMSLRGAACWKVTFESHKWPVSPEELPKDMREHWREERGMVWPFKVTPVDPLAVMPAPGGDWPIPWIIEHQKRTAWEVKFRYGDDWKDDQGKLLDPASTVDWVEFWSAPWFIGKTWYPGWYIINVDGKEIIGVENPYGVVPYAFEYSGMGRLDRSGDPAHLAVNLIEKAQNELKSEAALKTAMDAVWQFTAFPRLMTTEDARVVKAKWDLSAGGILQVKGLKEGERPEWMTQPQIDSAMWNFLPVVSRSIERSTFSSVLEGQRQPGVDFGYLQALLVGQASLRKDNIIGMASRLFARGVSVVERMMRHMDIGPIVLGPGSQGEKNRTITPEEIGNRFDLNVRIEASDPAEQDRRMLSWLSPLRAGVIGKRDYLEHGMMMDNPDEVLARYYAEQVVEQIILSGAVAQEILEGIKSEEGTASIEQATGGLMDEAQTAVERVPGTPPAGESPVARSPLSVINSMQSVDRRATSLAKRA